VTRPQIAVFPGVIRAAADSPGRLAAVPEHTEYALVAREIASRVWDYGYGVTLLPLYAPYDLINAVIEEVAGILMLPGADIAPKYWGGPDDAAINPDPRRDAPEVHAVKAAVRHHVPLLGICRGCQIINVVMGGTLIADLDVGPLSGRHRTLDGGRVVRHDVAVKHEWAESAGWPWTFEVASLHHQSIDRLAENLEEIAWSPDGTVEAFIGRTTPLLGVQWHPDLMGSHEAGASEPLRWLADAASRSSSLASSA